jgi:hypothetical protein
MTFEAYQKGNEEREKKDLEIHELKEQMYEMGNVMKKLDSSMRIYRNEFLYYVMEFGQEPRKT